jgi:hypothetical protein
VAVKGLGQVGDEQAVDPLIKALKDRVEEVRCRAAEALSRSRTGATSGVPPQPRIHVGWNRRLAGMIQSEKQKSQEWTATKIVVVLFFVVGLAVIPVLALLITFRCTTMACSEPSWEDNGIAFWTVAWPIAWVVLAAAFYRRRRVKQTEV